MSCRSLHAHPIHLFDGALREIARTAYDEGCALILAIHSWVLPGNDEQEEPLPTGVIAYADRLLDTLATHPAIVMVLTGHRHRNRIRMAQDCVILDTACLIGFPMGFREIMLQEDGMFRTRFHQLDLPHLIQASFDRSGCEENRVWEGEPHDRNTEMVLPRLQALWG